MKRLVGRALDFVGRALDFWPAAALVAFAVLLAAAVASCAPEAPEPVPDLRNNNDRAVIGAPTHGTTYTWLHRTEWGDLVCVLHDEIEGSGLSCVPVEGMGR